LEMFACKFEVELECEAVSEGKSLMGAGGSQV
jgi:hypothetical protein